MKQIFTVEDSIYMSYFYTNLQFSNEPVFSSKNLPKDKIVIRAIHSKAYRDTTKLLRLEYDLETGQVSRICKSAIWTFGRRSTNIDSSVKTLTKLNWDRIIVDIDTFSFWYLDPRFNNEASDNYYLEIAEPNRYKLVIRNYDDVSRKFESNFLNAIMTFCNE
ncbi:MAG: hypothetical protein ACXWEY_08865 [Bacteroidia bacterium]